MCTAVRGSLINAISDVSDLAVFFLCEAAPKPFPLWTISLFFSHLSPFPSATVQIGVNEDDFFPTEGATESRYVIHKRAKGARKHYIF